LLSFIAKLQGNKKAFHRPEQAKTNHDSEGQENHQMNPKGRFESQLCPERRTENEKSADQADEDGGAVTGIGKGKIKSAPVAFFTKIDEVLEGLALPAARAASEQACPVGR